MCFLYHKVFNLNDELITSSSDAQNISLDYINKNITIGNKEKSNAINSDSIVIREEHILMSKTEIKDIKDQIGKDNVYI